VTDDPVPGAGRISGGGPAGDDPVPGAGRISGGGPAGDGPEPGGPEPGGPGIGRRGTLSVKWDAAGRIFGTPGVLPLWVADMDFASPPAVIEALRARLDHGVMGYSFAPESFVGAFVRWLETRHGWTVSPEWVVFSPKVMFSVSSAVSAFTEPGDRIVVQPPVYPPLISSVERNGREVLYNTLRREEGRYRMDLDRLAAGLDRAADEGRPARLLILCSPHNPVGRVWTPEELRGLGRICLDRGVLILSDEIHFDLVFPESRHTPIASLDPELAAGSVVLASPSKTFNIPGIWSSFAVIPDEEHREAFRRRLEEQGMSRPSLMGILATEAAYRGGAAWLDETLGYLRGNRDFLADFLSGELPEITTRAPEGTYLVWLDFGSLGMDDAGLKDFLVRKAGLGLNPGELFGPGGSGFARLNLGCSRSLLRRALEQLRDAVRDVTPRR